MHFSGFLGALLHVFCTYSPLNAHIYPFLASDSLTLVFAGSVLFWQVFRQKTSVLAEFVIFVDHKCVARRKD